MEECLFCKIIRKEIPSYTIFENEHIKAFLDVSPTTKGHTLVVPKIHCEDIFSLSKNTVDSLFQGVIFVANKLKSTLPLSGLNVINNNGAIAGQTIFHYHVHLIPRYGVQDNFSMNWKVDDSIQLTEMCSKITGGI